MKRAYWFVVAHFIAAIVCAVLLKFEVAADGSPSHKFLAGFFIGTYALFGKEIAKLFIACAKRRELPRFDSSHWLNSLMLAALVMLAMAGLFAWFVSWEGSTGSYFGLAVFVAALLSDEGLAPLFKEYSPV